MTKTRILAIFIFTVIIVNPRPSVGWNFTIHRWVAAQGMTEIEQFIPSLEGEEATVVSYSVAPDEWRAASKGDEGPNHYFDYPNGPGKIHKAILSWSIYLASELGSDNFNKVVPKIIGILCHYAGDINNPLHCTVNYDPPDAYFTHADIDSWFKSTELNEIDLDTIHPDIITDIYNHSTEIIERNYLIAENILIPAMYNNDIQIISEVVENQTIFAVDFFVDLIYTSYINSNGTNIESLMNPQGRLLIDTTIYPRNQLDQEVVPLLLIGGIIILMTLYILMKKKKSQQ
ncbi:MAG: hypothetical protein ACW99Q_08160 [Candidatus Kariarchaeaceae archaeon]|jgi:hypothetical protein